MDLENLLDKRPLRNLRNTVATIRAFTYVFGFTGAALAFLYLRFWKDNVSASVAIAVGVSFVTLIAVTASFGYYIRNIHDPDYYEILELESVLLVESVANHHKYTYTRRQRVRANRNELRLIELNAHWTGAGSRESFHVESLIPDHILLDGKRREEDGRIRRWIYPRRAVNKGREVEVGVRQVHEDDIEAQLPYFRESGGRHRTHRLSVTVRFPRDEDPESAGEIKGMIWNSYLYTRQNHATEYQPPVRHSNQDGTVDYTLVVHKPKLFRSYGIVWEQYLPDG